MRKLLTFYKLVVFWPNYLHDLLVDDSRDWFRELEELMVVSKIPVDGMTLMTAGGLFNLSTHERYEKRIFELLLRKGVDIFTHKKIAPKTAVVNAFARTWNTEVPVMLDDSPTSILNQEELFSSVNEVLASEVSSQYLDYQKCLKLKRNIQSEIEEERSDSFFIDQL